MSTVDASAQLSPSREGSSCSVGREVYTPDPDTTPSRVSQLCVTQHADHDMEAVACAPRWTASPPARRDAADELVGPAGERSGVARLFGVPPCRAGGQSADVGTLSDCYRQTDRHTTTEYTALSIAVAR